MKHIILVLALITSVSFAQNWTNVIDTDVDVSSAYTPVDIFANGNGLHIIYKEINSLKYVKMDVEGSAGSPVTLEDSSVVWPSITGDASTIYVVYRKSSESYIRTKFSTDGGTNWNYLATNPSNSDADFIESIYSEEKLHITYEVSNSVYYSNYVTSWLTPYTVSNTENGSLPRIAAWNGNSEDKVYFNYQNSASVSKWREYNVTNNTWGNIQTAFTKSNFYPSGFAVDGNNIALYYNYLDAPFYYFQWVVRRKSDNTLLCTRTAEPSYPQIVYSTTTVDEQMHAPFWFNWGTEEQEDPGIWRSNGDIDCTIDEVYVHNDQEQQNVHFINTAASSNDVYVIWQDDDIGDNLRLIYDDAAPLTPENFAGTTYNNHPKLTWTLNNEPDIAGYEIYRLLTTGSGVYELLTTVSSGTSSYVDNGVQLGGSTMGRVFYKIRAKDNHPYYSGYTPVIRYNYSGLNKVTVENQSFEYLLSANYPNPFNPSTQIKYSLAQDADVTLKVYDMLGTEVTELVNESQTAGSYEINFNAENLSSGAYVYRITATNNGMILFTDSKQMILLR